VQVHGLCARCQKRTPSSVPGSSRRRIRSVRRPR
jgi:hypothetical protein